jgi:hypothetical protein
LAAARSARRRDSGYCDSRDVLARATLCVTLRLLLKKALRNLRGSSWFREERACAPRRRSSIVQTPRNNPVDHSRTRSRRVHPCARRLLYLAPAASRVLSQAAQRQFRVGVGPHAQCK